MRSVRGQAPEPAPEPVPARAAGRARLSAWLIDVLCISGWVLILAIVGVTVYLTGSMPPLSGLAADALSFVVLVLPVTLTFARAESRPRQATVGKRAMGLKVVQAGTFSRVSFERALLRNAVKIAIPWTLGHVVVYGLAGSDDGAPVPAWLVVATVAAYVLPATYVVMLFTGGGRPPHDRLSRTVVVRAQPHS